MLLLAIAALTGGCAAIATSPLTGDLFSSRSTGDLEIHQNTSINLQQANYFIIKTNIVGKSKGFALLGFITIVPARFQKADDRLYAKAAIETGKPQALANFVMEKSSSYWILFSIPRVTVRADLVEFIAAGANSNAPPFSAMDNSSKADALTAGSAQ